LGKKRESHIRAPLIRYCVAMIAGVPSQTLFDPVENYPPGVLREVVVWAGTDVLYAKFYPECHEVTFAIDNRTSDSVELMNKRYSSSYEFLGSINRAEESWSLDEISSEKTKWRKGKLMVEWDKDKCEMMKRDIKKITEMLEWQEKDLRNMEEEAERLLQRLPENEEIDEWLKVHTFTEEEEDFFEIEIADMNLHRLRASAGPPTGKYLMNLNYDRKTGRPIQGRKCWVTEYWCPEMGRLSLTSKPESYECFSTFNEDFVHFGIQWPKEIQGKTEGKCGQKRFSCLKSCGRWMEQMMDNEGRFVANGYVFSIGKHAMTILTEYGYCTVGLFDVNVGDEVKLLCKDNRGFPPIRCMKIISMPGS